MAEYIEREALKQVLNRYLNAPHVQMGNSVGQGMRIAIKSCIELLENEYAADVAPVRHGRWIVRRKGMNNWVDCSECGTIGSPVWKCCPVCEAKMDGEI